MTFLELLLLPPHVCVSGDVLCTVLKQTAETNRILTLTKKAVGVFNL